MQVTLLSIGKTRDAAYAQLEREYSKRIRGRFSCTLSYVKNEKELIKTVADFSGEVVLLSENGSVMNSREFAEYLSSAATRTQHLLLVIGDAHGLPEALREYETDLLALSEMTFPHEMARVILLEQLYRAQSIIEGHPYHK